LPTFLPVKMTVPTGAVVFESLDLNSLAVTVMWVVTVFVVAPDAEPATIAEPTIPSAADDARLRGDHCRTLS
jgi:hypothetical protein